MEGLGVCCQLESSKNLKVIISEHKNVNTVNSAGPSQTAHLPGNAWLWKGRCYAEVWCFPFSLSLSLLLTAFLYWKGWKYCQAQLQAPRKAREALGFKALEKWLGCCLQRAQPSPR